MKEDTKKRKSVGGVDYTEAVVDGRLVLTFEKQGTCSDGSKYDRHPVLLAGYVAKAFQYQADEKKRAEKDRLEREGSGVDPHVLAKMRREIEKLLVKYDNRTIQKANAIKESVRAFAVGEQVKIGKDAKLTPGKTGIVKSRRQKYLTIEIEGKLYRVPPSLIERTVETREAV